MTASPHRLRASLRTLPQSRWLHFLLLAALLTVLAAAMERGQWNWCTALDTLPLDLSFKFRQPHTPGQVADALPATRDIVMVELSHPIPREGLADLLWRLREAKVVGLDQMLVPQTEEFNSDEQQWYADEYHLGQRGTDALSTMIHRTGNVVLGAWSDEIWLIQRQSKDEEQGNQNSPRENDETVSQSKLVPIDKRPPKSLLENARAYGSVAIAPNVPDKPLYKSTAV